VEPIVLVKAEHARDGERCGELIECLHQL